ncbi:kynU [Symbiodinium sp. KB8]|nr:kynU [Symbiodinium sp. KB8]
MATSETESGKVCEEFKATYDAVLQEAAAFDKDDPLAKFRERFSIPVNSKTAEARKDKPYSIYFCGNSLGLKPKSLDGFVQKELDRWSEEAVECHFKGENPWMTYDELCKPPLAKIVGANPKEVAVMNSLTANLHFMMIPFYRPTKQRYKVLVEYKSFPSDFHVISSHIEMHGLKVEDCYIEMKPRAGESLLRMEDIEKTILEHKDEIALILIGGVHYYTGQLFDMKKITELGHSVGAKVGFDLAHAVGNVPLHLHDWDVDFAVWCSYKYLNAGPGTVGGIFVHEKFEAADLHPRLAGWWGHRKEDR